MTKYEIFSDQLPHYENTINNIFNAKITNELKLEDIYQKSDWVRPSRNYFICFTNRSGSTLLALMLARTGAMGAPGEIFNPEPLTNARQKHGVSSFSDFVDFKLKTTSKQGTFGAKIGVHQLAYLAKNGYLREEISAPKFIYITRQNIVMQAISLYLAWETGAWSSNVANPQQQPEYSLEGITQQLKSILMIQAQFETFFALHQIQPLRISYEAIDTNLESIALRVCKYVGVVDTSKLQFVRPALKKQRTEINEEWAARFISEYKNNISSSPVDFYEFL